MAEDPLKVYDRIYHKMRKRVEIFRSLAFEDGALRSKVKNLVAMALGASHGSTEGAKALARAAIKAGATQEEIAEVLRVALYVCGVGSAYAAAHALKEVFWQRVTEHAGGQLWPTNLNRIL